MAVTEDELFERAIDEIVKVAGELLKDKDPKAKTFVTEQINDLQKSIEQKLIQAEKEDDETEIQSIQDRIKKLLERGVEDPGDKALDHVKVFQNLKEKEWEEVISETEDPLHIVHEKLLNILKRAFKAAAERMRDSRAKIVQQVLQPGSDFKKTQDRRQDVEAVHKQEADLIELSSQCQLKAMPFCIDSIKKNIRDAILDEDKDLCTVPNASDALNTAIDNYFLKCIEFSWAAAFEELPPILLVCDPKKECPKISGSFTNLKKVPRQYTVVWPALVQGDSIISPWVLSEKTQPHPIATHTRVKDNKN
ncbi:uncharacterized protein LOC127877743 [Dreissena polymorpha]|uniref:Mitochondria-eating protein C-terminal domain-containing protein n=1 Tax=Dreissena polymorpha TaxID=45954 RepID=A0A9D4KPM2_DREPO|nr:uncharacterized protein LOC127877743 [Dreissena polymorpha]XP_052279892.1 uncharacterized protein LOC127877743 [Dreissena polymorpha]XP_052279893.1 uncharacterized protein LOC127877743 [Dreissena polymorpha]XP_052279894.1 uncharacterized protein LOC127877743 [Dreissena polymorpha]XP_052279896.1 uncharacterized protein LOC127877743 [Dreissena polymorpha]KAH3843304.1 hypothetical protein DPMN_116818 [Dreissena polymorpha]